jgi:hypothetical protein
MANHIDEQSSLFKIIAPFNPLSEKNVFGGSKVFFKWLLKIP